MTRRLAIIPARAGSKCLPRKNLLPLRGRPMLAYTVEAALTSHCFVCLPLRDGSAAAYAGHRRGPCAA